MYAYYFKIGSCNGRPEDVIERTFRKSQRLQREFIKVKEWKGKCYSFFYIRGDLQRTKLSAWRYIGISKRGIGFFRQVTGEHTKRYSN